MEHYLLEHPFLGMMITIFGTLFGKYVWDRYLSQTSRVTVAFCKMNQEVCRKEIMSEITKHSTQLSEGDSCFESTRKIQRAVLLTLIEICNHDNIPYDEEKRL